VYYFNYKNGVMRAWSTTEEFNTAINEVAEGKRRAEQERGRSAYRYQIAPEEAAEKFRKKMKKRY